MFGSIPSTKSSNFALFSKRIEAKNSSTGISNVSFVFKWVENGVFPRSPLAVRSAAAVDEAPRPNRLPYFKGKKSQKLYIFWNLSHNPGNRQGTLVLPFPIWHSFID